MSGPRALRWLVCSALCWGAGGALAQPLSQVEVEVEVAPTRAPTEPEERAEPDEPDEHAFEWPSALRVRLALIYEHRDLGDTRFRQIEGIQRPLGRELQLGSQGQLGGELLLEISHRMLRSAFGMAFVGPLGAPDVTLRGLGSSAQLQSMYGGEWFVELGVGRAFGEVSFGAALHVGYSRLALDYGVARFVTRGWTLAPRLLMRARVARRLFVEGSLRMDLRSLKRLVVGLALGVGTPG